MSASLLRKGLELLGEPAGSGPAPARGRHSRIPEKKRPSRRNQATAKGRVPKSALEEFQKRQRRDHLQENLRFMKKKLVAVDPKITTKILLQNQGRKAKDRPATKLKKEKPQGTVFTEEDFRKFQEEYFGNSGTK
ncbi:active regulator of SIRT1 isoform X1 [Sarcophilus harrisii]|uniref:Active regulator of SIRT1 n=1 Tax=Sarcophilus harrisii TaxID=9305 RepID=A0A7N4NM24_SARHA|nr:active regulator of SIRT1 isoform X1 [Sarcophilus harrisii]